MSIKLHQVNKIILDKQHLTENSKIDDILKISEDLCGLHATDPKTPFLSLLARTLSFKKEDLERELYVNRNLGKMRCMRKTIFIQPKHMIPITFCATNKLLEKRLPKVLEVLGITPTFYKKSTKSILDNLKGKSLSTSEIKKSFCENKHVGSILTLMCDQGLLIRSKPIKNWKDRRNTYAIFSEHFPNVDLTKLSETEALIQLTQRYITSYGPITEKDLSWWTGLTLSEIRNALTNISTPIEKIKISDLSKTYLMLRSDIRKIDNLMPSKTPTLNLLPILDPYMMGYKERERYISSEHYNKAYDRSGNATSTILFNGIVIGIWDITEKPNLLVKLYLFDAVDDNLKKEIYKKAKEIGIFYFDKSVQIKECDTMEPLTNRSAGNFMKPLENC